MPDDYRVGRYARGTIRGYIDERIVDILDKAAYGVALTPEEARTLAFVQAQQLDADRKLTRYAYEEYTEWKRLGCAYRSARRSRRPSPAPLACPTTSGSGANTRRAS